MKRSELLVSTLLVPLDALAIFGAFLLSYFVRIESGALPVSYVLPRDRFYKISLAITAVWLVIFALCGLYSLKSTRRGLSEFARILAAVSIGTLTVIAVIFFLREDFASRLIVVFGFAAAVVLVTLVRALVRMVQQAAFRYGIGVRRALIVGTGRMAEILAEELTSRRGYVIIGHVAGTSAAKNVKTIGLLKDLPQLIVTYNPDEIIDADPTLPDGDKLEIIEAAEDAHTDVRFVSNAVELSTARMSASAIAGIPVLTLEPTPLEGWGRILKRLFDLAGSLLALPFVLLLLPFIAVAIKLDSRGPVIFKQTRVGRGGREFTSYKFRSMVSDAEERLASLQAANEADGPVFKIKHDPRVTAVGRFLRKSSLDELPQFFNVLKGDMSLVGPRPPLPAEVDQYTREQRRRLTIKPGITGPWQVSGRSDVSFEEWVRLDLYYIQHWSLLLDVTILLKTVSAVLLRRGAY